MGYLVPFIKFRFFSLIQVAAIRYSACFTHFSQDDIIRTLEISPFVFPVQYHPNYLSNIMDHSGHLLRALLGV